MKQCVLIIGSSGMLGVDLCKELKKDYLVYGSDIADRVSGIGDRFEKVDITDKKDVQRVVSKVGPDAVILTAAYTDVDGCEKDPKKAYKVNSKGPENVAIACKKAGALLIYISTDFVFNGRKKLPYVETDKTAPLSVYGDSKLKGEEAVRKYADKYFIVRTSWLYGRNGKNFPDTIVSKAKTEKVLKVVDDQVGSPTCTIDLSEGLHVLLDRHFYGPRTTDHGIYHFSNRGSVSWFDYAKKILKFSGSKTKVVPISSKDLARPAKRPAMSVMDCSKFTCFTGYKMREWGIALQEYLD